MNYVRPKIVVLAIYKSKDGSWRGFCSPYDVSCNAPTKEEVMKRLEKLVVLYEDGLKQYNYPGHLSVKKLSDPEGQAVFNIIMREISQQISKRMEKRFLEYQKEQERKNRFSIDNRLKPSGYYYQPCHSV